jgi:hypothetical protein
LFTREDYELEASSSSASTCSTSAAGPMLATLEQELYPYAAGGPVTFMRPGQAFWGDQRTVGGWYRGTPDLKAMLIKAGLPKAEPGHRHFVSVLLAILRRFLP